MKFVKVTPIGRPYSMIRLGPGWIYAEPNGHACLRWETSWKKISGIWINTLWGCIWIQVRRLPR